MPKSVVITPRIQNLIQQNNGGETVDLNSILVFEASVLNTRPLKKPGSIFDAGRVSVDTLNQMATYLNSGGFVPLQTLHPTGDELPIGRFFYAQVMPSTLGDGSTELVAMFYLPKNDPNAEKLDQGIIDEVSVGVVAQHLNCSQCSWDYMGADATGDNFWDRTCANGHTLGVDGVHLNLVGLDRWTETSLVSKGAANNAKILGRTKQRLGQEQYDRLAASGVAPEQKLLIATTTDKPRSRTMDKELLELMTQMSDLKADAKVHKHESDAKDAQIATLTASVAAKDAQIAKLSEGTELKEATTKLAESEAKVTELTTAKDSAEAKLAEVEGKLATAEAKVAVLEAGAGNGGRSKGASDDNVTLSASNTAFKSAPRR
jgi:phage shock protein A